MRYICAVNLVFNTVNRFGGNSRCLGQEPFFSLRYWRSLLFFDCLDCMLADEEPRQMGSQGKGARGSADRSTTCR